jgi:hypothetical protein
MGAWADALRKSLTERASGILQSLKDDRSGKRSLKPTERRAAMILLRKVMTAKQIRDELASVPEVPKKRRTR